ncbi:hypothetical protein ACP70R_016165 [Stipagrostis hirtigluma subsp. patula]
MGGVTYQRLLSPGSGARGGGGARARAWALLRWAAVRLSGAARRRWCARARRLAWAGLCGRAPAAAERRGRRSTAAAAAPGYDPLSYARNFDDGAWKAEEGVRWGGGAFARASVGSAAATGDSVSSSSS